MSDFSIKFRGVRGSLPVADRKFLNYGGNTSCVEVNVGGHLIILDAGTGIVSLGDDLTEQYISSDIDNSKRNPINSTILLSHIHQDHLLGLTFYKPLHNKNSNITIFGMGDEKNSLAKNLSELFFGKTFPLELGDIACNLSIEDLIENQAILLRPSERPILVESNYQPNENEVFITFYKSYVHPQDGVIIYRITYKNKSLVYATDKECYFGGDVKFIKFARGCNLLIHDSQYTTEDYLNILSPKQGFGHSTYDMAIETMKKCEAKNLAFFHYDPSYNDEKLEHIKEYYTTGSNNIFMAYEGLEFNI